MLKDNVTQTLKFFDLQDTPLTLLELYTYLLGQKASLDELLKCLDGECGGEVEVSKGFYCLKGRRDIITKRLQNYAYGIEREKLIRRYVHALIRLPFVRGVGLAGSQALGQQKESSDIDLFIVTDGQFMWLARTLVTAYFQLIGKRRYGNKIANRFCLNHYISAPREVLDYKNLYTAAEYIKLRPLVYEQTINRFRFNNTGWISALFPNAELLKGGTDKQSSVQRVLERIFTNKFGYWLEQKLKNWQLPKIRTEEEFIVVRDDELSFHPQSKQQALLEAFFEGNPGKTKLRG